MFGNGAQNAQIRRLGTDPNDLLTETGRQACIHRKGRLAQHQCGFARRMYLNFTGISLTLQIGDVVKHGRHWFVCFLVAAGTTLLGIRNLRLHGQARG